jgi:hypothetical protein
MQHVYVDRQPRGDFLDRHQITRPPLVDASASSTVTSSAISP